MSREPEMVQIPLPGDITRADFETYYLGEVVWPHIRKRRTETKRAAEEAEAARERCAR